MSTANIRDKDIGWGWSLAIIAGVLLLLWVVIYPSQNVIIRPDYRTRPCIKNLNEIGKAMEMYAQAWGDRRLPLYTTDQRAPQGKAWPDLLMPYMRKLRSPADKEPLAMRFRCPDSSRDRLNYSLNRRTAGWKVARIKYPSTTIAVFDSVNDSPENNNLNGDSMWRLSDGGMPSVGSLPFWPEKQPLLGRKLPEWESPRHHGTSFVLWVDGHVSSMSPTYPPDHPQYAPRFDPTKPLTPAPGGKDADRE